MFLNSLLKVLWPKVLEKREDGAARERGKEEETEREREEASEAGGEGNTKACLLVGVWCV